MKRILALIMSVLLLLSLAACVSNDSEELQTTDIQTSAESIAVTEGNTVVPETLSLGGTDISEYKITYSANILGYLYSRYDDLVTQDTEYDEQSAKYLAERIKTQFGATVETVKGSSEGKTISIVTNQNLSSPDSTKFKSDKSYVISMKDGSLEIYGATYSATYRAIDALFEHILALNVKNASLAADFRLEGEADILVVGCIGDSLTNGSKPTGYTSEVDDTVRRDIVSYPAVMQRIMWKDMVVYNYGLGGRTMIENFVWEGDGNHAYNVCSQYTLCMENAANIDLALIMLGTNDANNYRLTQAGKYVYTAKFKDELKDSCENIVNALKEKNADMRVLLLNAPVAYSENVKDNLDNYIRDYQKYTAEQLGLTLIDVYTYTNTNMTNEDFPDSLHPDDKGYSTFAEGISTLITPTLSDMLATRER